MSGVSASSPSPAPRRVARPSWLDLRLVLGVLLVLASVLIGAKIVSGASKTHAAVTATRDLAAGTVLTADDLRLSQVQVPGRGRDVYLADTKDAIGQRLERAVSRGELVPSAAVAKVKAQTTLTVPLAAGAAPRLRSGQRIEVWVSSSSCPFVVLLPDVTVQSVHADADGSISNGRGGQDVVISVEPAIAGRVIAALAIDGVTLRAGVLVGRHPSAVPSAAVPSASPPSSGSQSESTPQSGSTPPQSGGDPTDLAACASPSATR